MSGVGHKVSSRAWGTVRTWSPHTFFLDVDTTSAGLFLPGPELCWPCPVWSGGHERPFSLSSCWGLGYSGRERGRLRTAENLGLGVTAFDPLLQIADFGLSNLYHQGKFLQTFCGSPLYASPEIVNGKPYTGPEVSVHPLLPGCLIHFL